MEPPRLTLAIALSMASLAISALPVRAADSVEPSLEPVTVSAGRGITLEDLDVSTTALERDEILASPQTATEQLVNRIPGVFTLHQIEQVRYRSVGGSAFYQRDLGAIADLRVGVDLRMIDADDDIRLFGPSAQNAAIVVRGKHSFQGVFAQGTWRPATLAKRLPDASHSRFNPRIGARYFLLPELVLRAAAYRNFAAPGMNQMYRSFVSGSSYAATNPDLAPQTNRGRELGVDYTTAAGGLSFTLFDNELHDFIDFVPLCTTAVACDPLIVGTGLASGSVTRVNRYVNAGDAVLRGFELLGRYAPTPALRFKGSFVRTQAHLKRSTT